MSALGDGPLGTDAAFPVDRSRAVDRAGLKVAAVAWVGSLVISIFWVGALAALSGDASFDSSPLWVAALGNVPLWLVLGGAPVLLARSGEGLQRELRWAVRRSDVVVGCVTGVGAQLLMIPALYWLIFRVIGERDLAEPARELAERAESGGAVGLAAFVVMTVVLAPITEELFYRGLVLGGLEARMPRGAAAVVSAGIFGAVHFQPLQFAGLAVFGLVLALLVQRTDRLGPAVWAHLAFNLTAVVVQLSL